MPCTNYMQVPIANTENKETFCTGIKRDTMLTFNYHQEKLVTYDILHAWAANFFHQQPNCFKTNPCKKQKQTNKKTFNTFSMDQNILTPTNINNFFKDCLALYLMEKTCVQKQMKVLTLQMTPVQPSKTNICVHQFHFKSNTVKTGQS